MCTLTMALVGGALAGGALLNRAHNRHKDKKQTQQLLAQQQQQQQQAEQNKQPELPLSPAVKTADTTAVNPVVGTTTNSEQQTTQPKIGLNLV